MKHKSFHFADNTAVTTSSDATDVTTQNRLCIDHKNDMFQVENIYLQFIGVVAFSIYINRLTLINILL